METADHLFIGCDVLGSVWYLICHWLGISFVSSGSISEHYVQFTNLTGMPRASHSTLKVIWLACMWAIWKDRNHLVLKNVVTNPHNILETVKLINSFLWLSSSKIPLSFRYHDWWRHALLCMSVM